MKNLREVASNWSQIHFLVHTLTYTPTLSHKNLEKNKKIESFSKNFKNTLPN